MHTSLRARDCITYGWDTFIKRPWFFIGATILYLVAVFALDAISGFIFTRMLGLKDLTKLVNWVIMIFVSMGLTALMLNAYADPFRARIRDLWHPRPFWKYLGAYLLALIIISFGFFLLVIPGVIWGLMFCFAMYLVIDREHMPIEALKESARITKGHRWMLFRLGILAMLLLSLGFFCFVVGIVVAMPVVQLASIHAYRTFSSTLAPVAPQGA